MAWRTMVMNIDLEGNEELNLIKDVRARLNACYKCGEVGHFQRDCKYDGDKPTDNQQVQSGQSPSDSYDAGGRKMDDQFSGHLPLLQ